MEKSHTKTWQRVAVFVIALLFILTSATLTIFALMDSSSGQTDNSAANTPTCTISPTAGSALPAPEIFKTSDKVTKLETKDLTVGKGAAAKSGDCLEVKYYGTLADSGKKFDENFTEPTALKFQLGQGQVIPGWDLGVAGMKVGGERRLVIPSDLAYGEAGSPPTIPSNATLVFVVKLLKIDN